MAHFAVRGLMHEAALSAAEDPDRPPSALFPPRKRKQFHSAVLEEILDDVAASSRSRRNPRGVKRKTRKTPDSTRLHALAPS